MITTHPTDNRSNQHDHSGWLIGRLIGRLVGWWAGGLVTLLPPETAGEERTKKQEMISPLSHRSKPPNGGKKKRVGEVNIQYVGDQQDNYEDSV